MTDPRRAKRAAWLVMRVVLAVVMMFSSLTVGSAAAEAVVGSQEKPHRPLATVAVTLDAEESFRWAGVVDLDGAGVAQNNMLYGPGPVGFVATLIAHATIVHTTKSSQKTRMQEAADKVLEPLQPELSAMRAPRLMAQVIERLSLSNDKVAWLGAVDPAFGGWRMESRPTFLMTQDRAALVLTNEVQVKGPSSDVVVVRMRVVSEPVKAEDLVSHWRDKDGEQLQSVSANLLARSLEIAWNSAGPLAQPATPTEQRSYRYMEGTSRRIERGELLSARCGSLLIKTLRGDLLEVPVRRDEAECDTQRNVVKSD